jgi:HEXXH motif-containing protein
MTAFHRLEPDLFEGLASGAGGRAAIEVLRSAQLSKHLMLITELVRHWPGSEGERDAVTDALDRARQRDPASFGDVMSRPLVGAWAAIVNRAVVRAAASPDDFGHLAGWAMAACAAAGVDASATVPIRDGEVLVPGLGAAGVGDATAAELVATGGRLEVRTGNGAVAAEPGGAGWRPVRDLEAATGGLTIRVGLDDLDPYRHGYHAPPAPRLPETEVDRWRALLQDAWQLLAEHVPGRAEELAAGLRTLVPLVGKESDGALSATLRHAFGLFGLTRPPSAVDFAVTLVHEFQHSKLSAILDLMPLSDPADRRRYFAPWRTDPRPLAGLLQGVYAFVGVADTWGTLRSVDAVAAVAEAQFAEARLQVDRGLTAVEESGGLTPDGEALISRLRTTTDALLAEPLPAATIAAAERALAWTRERWEERNGMADRVTAPA